MNNNVILAGFGKADITPLYNIYLGGYSNDLNRKSTFIKEDDPLEARALALTDEAGKTLLFVITDLCWGTKELTDNIRRQIKSIYDIEEDSVFLGGTDNHSGPSYEGEALNEPCNREYMVRWNESVMRAIRDAMADRCEAEVFVGTTETHNVNFVRRYARKDGTLVGAGLAAWYGDNSVPIEKHESDVDPHVQMVRFVRDGYKDILIAQWQAKACHLSGMVKGTHLCATDYVGPMRQYVEEDTDCHFLFMQGCAANVGTASKIPNEMELHARPTESQIGYMVGKTIVQAYYTSDTFKPINAGNFRVLQQTISEPAKGWQAEMNTISLGDLSVATFPVQLFDTAGIKIKEETPFEMTLLMGHTNGIGGICASAHAFALGGYETTSRGVEGTAERIVQTQLDALHQLHD